MELTLGQPVRKYTGKVDASDWQVMTDRGWADIKTVGETVPYEVWEVKTFDGKRLRCADTHILFDSEWDEIYARDLNKTTRPDMIQTADGCEVVENVRRIGVLENMYDIEVDTDEHRYYTNGIVSHNSIFLCNDAAYFCKCGKNVVYITCEMSDRKIIRRIGANLLDIDLKDYNRMAANRQVMFDAIQKFRSRQLTPIGRLFVKEYPTATATVIDIENYLKHLHDTKGVKIDVVVIDYINILKNYRCRDAANTYINIKHLAEDLRALAVKYEMLVITATQVNRSGFDTSDVSGASMSESTALLATADQGYAIIQDTALRTERKYALKIIKIRDGFGKNSRVFLDIEYSKMRLVEDGTVLNENNEEVNARAQYAAASAPKVINPAVDGEKNKAELFNANENGFAVGDDSFSTSDVKLGGERPNDFDVENLGF